MKILHIAEFGNKKTGIGTVVERLYMEQTMLGHEVRIVTTSPNLAYKHLKLFHIKTKENFKKLIEVWQPNAVLFHSIWAMPYISFAKILRNFSIPYAVMMHGANSDYNNKKNHIKKEIANLLFFNNFLRKAKTIIFLSNSEYKRCVSSNINPCYDIIPNGCELIDLDLSHKVLNDPVIITYLGRMAIEIKGLNYLFEAIRLLRLRGLKNVKFKFYGNENDIDIIETKKQIALLSEMVSFEGPVYGDEKKKVLFNTDIFILTSPSEGMPMGVLEALSHGVPCILTPGTNMAEDVVEAGAGWKAELDAESIANIIEKAVDDLRLNSHQFYEAAYKMSKRYDWKIIAKQHVEVMKNISVS